MHNWTNPKCHVAVAIKELKIEKKLSCGGYVAKITLRMNSM